MVDRSRGEGKVIIARVFDGGLAYALNADLVITAGTPGWMKSAMYRNLFRHCLLERCWRNGANFSTSLSKAQSSLSTRDCLYNSR